MAGGPLCARGFGLAGRTHKNTHTHTHKTLFKTLPAECGCQVTTPASAGFHQLRILWARSYFAANNGFNAKIRRRYTPDI